MKQYKFYAIGFFINGHWFRGESMFCVSGTPLKSLAADFEAVKRFAAADVHEKLASKL